MAGYYLSIFLFHIAAQMTFFGHIILQSVNVDIALDKASSQPKSIDVFLISEQIHAL